MSERDIWQPHADPQLAPLETHLYGLGAGLVMRVQRDVFTALALPGLPADEVRAAYRLPLIAKADEASWSRAASLLTRLRALRLAGKPAPAELYARLAGSVTDKWLAAGKLTDRASATAVATYLTGLLQSGGLAPEAAEAAYHAARAGSAEARHQATVDYATARAAEHLQALSDTLRHDVASAVLTGAQAQQQPQHLASELFKRFAANARDWRRVALTETATNQANGYLAGLEGQTVEWRAADEACRHCGQLHGRAFLVVSPDHEPKDAAAHVWVGKHQRGHPIGSHPAVPLHPHCRCRYARVAARDESELGDATRAALARLRALAF